MTVVPSESSIVRRPASSRSEAAVAEFRLGCDHPPQRVGGNDEYFAGFGNTCGEEDPQSAEKVELTQEPPGMVTDDHSLLSSVVDQDVHQPGKHDVEVVVSVTLVEEVLSDGRRAPRSHVFEEGDL